MEGKKLEQVTKEKDLGILIDNEFKFHKQTAAPTKKVNSVKGLLKKSFILLDKMRLLYESVVCLHLACDNVICRGALCREH